jgi:hemolysin III
VTQAELEKIEYGNVPLLDGGPRYVETNFARLFVEPCNAITAAIFVAIVVFFMVRMWGRFRQHPFLCLAIPVLLLGGIGGTIYHALRAYKVFFYMDVVPIVLLVAMGSVYLWVRLRPRGWQVMALLAVIVTFAAVAGHFLFIGERHVAIIVQYLGLAVLVLTPVAIVLVRTNYRHSQIIKLALVCFGFAILFRFLDPVSAPVLPIGTHWLWHVLGAATTALLAEYFYRIETEPTLQLQPA